MRSRAVPRAGGLHHRRKGGPEARRFGAERRSRHHVYGLDDGEQLAPLSERRRLWAGTLPATQDYVVSVVPADDGARYELTVTLR